MIQFPHKSFQMAQYGSGNRVGTFILGSAFAWHGGIHLETNEDLVAVADGRLVAYRMADNYTQEEIEDVGKTRYSNCFVLLQHEMDADGTKLTYYSLYNHLWPASEMKDKFVSELFQKCTWEVKGEDEEGIYGIWGYGTDFKGDGTDLNALSPNFKDHWVVPLNTSLEVLGEIEIETVMITKKPVYERFLKVRRLTTYQIYQRTFFVKKDQVKIIGETTVNTFNPSTVLRPEILAVAKPLKRKALKDYAFERVGEKMGLRHYNKAGDVNDVETIIGVIAKGTKIVISGKPIMGKWHKVMDLGNGKEGGYVLLSGQEKFTVSPKFSKNEIVGCNIPVKAGTVIGKAGDYGHEINGKYKDSCHFEIFTSGDVEAFLNNASEKRLDYLKLNASCEFSAGLEIKTLPKGYPVQVIEKRGCFSKVKIPKLVKTVPYSYLGIYSSDSNSYALKGETNESYDKRQASSQVVAIEVQNLPKANLAELKNIFGDFLTEDDRLHYKNKTKTEREVYFDHTMAGRTVWIRTDWTEEPMAKVSPLGCDSVKVTRSTGQSVQTPFANNIIDKILKYYGLR